MIKRRGNREDKIEHKNRRALKMDEKEEVKSTPTEMGSSCYSYRIKKTCPNLILAEN